MKGGILSYYNDTERPGDCGSGVFIAEEADGVGDKKSPGVVPSYHGNLNGRTRAGALYDKG